MQAVTCQASHSLTFDTNGQGFTDISASLDGWLADAGAGEGLMHVFIAHTSASLTIQENADPDVQRDLLDALDTIAPRERAYRHASEGPDDMPSHIKAMVTSTSLAIPVRSGRMALGIWQGVYLIEHRDHPHSRRIELIFSGQPAVSAPKD